jgi:threonine dehydrogenase-like Zn-dependent dehydrogenase
MDSSSFCIRFTAPGQVEVHSSPIPSPGPGEVLIRTRRTLISAGTELSILNNRPSPGSAWAEFAQLPRQVGYSNAGEVVDIGTNVDRSWVGQRVASRSYHASFVTCEVSDLRPIPPGVSDEEATFATLAGVAMNGLRRVQLVWGESVAVFGLGILGQLAARIALIAGAEPIFVMEVSALRLGKLPQHPTIVGLPGDLNAALETVRQHTGGTGVDVAIEATAVASLIPDEAGIVRDQGRLLLLSSPHGATLFDFHDLCNRPSITIVGAHGFSQPAVPSPSSPWTAKRHGDLFLQWLKAGRLSVRELVTHRFNFQRAAEAYALLGEGPAKSMAAVLEWP